MKNFIKFAAVGLAGYFIGVYEVQYKLLKAMVFKDVKDESEKPEEVEES